MGVSFTLNRPQHADGTERKADRVPKHRNGDARKTTLAKDYPRHSCDKSGRNFRVGETSAGNKWVSATLRKFHHPLSIPRR
jgi:hypothetical protein